MAKNDINVVETNEESTIGVVTIPLKTPIEYEGITYEELHFNWDKLTGDDYLSVEKELTARGMTVLMAEFDTNFIMSMAVRACAENIDANFLRKLPLPTYNKIRSKGRSFLLNAE